MIPAKTNQHGSPRDVKIRASPAGGSGDSVVPDRKPVVVKTTVPDPERVTATKPRAKPTSQAQKIRYPAPPATKHMNGLPRRVDQSSPVLIIPNVKYHPQIVTKHFGGTYQRNHDRSCVPVSETSQINKPRRTGSVPRTEPTVKTPQANKGRPPTERPLPRPEEVPLGVGVNMEKGVVEAVEVQTRGQRENPDWFAWRQNRITASNAHRISRSRFVNGKSQVPAASYLAAITGEGPNVKTRAMNWGIEREAEAVRKYQNLKSRALGRGVLVQECGLFIDAQRPWLAASPDGIVVDKQTGQRLLCLEVKCPYKHRQNTVAQACREDPAFCLEIEEGDGERQPPVYSLKPGHCYYTQIQCQLAVTGLQRADLVVFTLRETAIVPVNFDPEFWEETVSKLEVFYRDGLLPYLRDKRQADVPAVRPEE